MPEAVQIVAIISKFGRFMLLLALYIAASILTGQEHASIVQVRSVKRCRAGGLWSAADNDARRRPSARKSWHFRYGPSASIYGIHALVESFDRRAKRRLVSQLEGVPVLFVSTGRFKNEGS